VTVPYQPVSLWAPQPAAAPNIAKTIPVVATRLVSTIGLSTSRSLNSITKRTRPTDGDLDQRSPLPPADKEVMPQPVRTGLTSRTTGLTDPATPIAVRSLRSVTRGVDVEALAPAPPSSSSGPEATFQTISAEDRARGGETALLIGSTYPTLVHGVIAAVPSNVALCGYPNCGDGSAWTLNGKEVPFTHNISQPAPSDNPNAVIRVERINGPVLMTCGGNDQVWSSCPYAQAALLRLAHSRYPHHLILCQACDHYIGNSTPDEPRRPYPGELQ
jgi:hypothetical protein